MVYIPYKQYCIYHMCGSLLLLIAVSKSIKNYNLKKKKRKKINNRKTRKRELRSKQQRIRCFSEDHSFFIFLVSSLNTQQKSASPSFIYY